MRAGRNIHKKRFKPRLPNHDYSSPCYYFITIDCYRMECHFGEIIKTKMMLSDFGKIAFDIWYSLSSRFPCFKSHIFQIMPNHLHAIVEIVSIETILNNKNISPLFEPLAGASPASTQSSFYSSGNLSNIMGAYKSLVADACLEFHKQKFSKTNLVPILGKIWKRSFNDKIIRNKYMFKSVRRYIKNNPKKWNRQ